MTFLEGMPGEGIEPVPVAEVAAVQAVAMGLVRETYENRRSIRQPRLVDAAMSYVMAEVEGMPDRFTVYGTEPLTLSETSLTGHARRPEPKGCHRFTVYDGGDEDPVAEPGYETYLGVSVKKDLQRRDKWDMLVSLRHIPLYDPEEEPTPEEPAVTTWEQYRFGWRRGQESCDVARVTVREYTHTVDHGQFDVSAPFISSRDATPDDCEVLRLKMYGIAKAIEVTLDNELRMLG